MRNTNNSVVSILDEEEGRLSWTATIIAIFFALTSSFLDVLDLFIALFGFFLRQIVELLMTRFYSSTCQLFFTCLCEYSFNSPADPKYGILLSTLTTLLFYTIFTHFLSKIAQALFLPVDRSSRSSSYVLRLFNIMLEFIKASIVILFLNEQKLEFHTQVEYIMLTFMYYICTEDFFVKSLIEITKQMKLEAFDYLEHLYVPIILHMLSILLSIVVLSFLALNRIHIVFDLFATLFTLYMPLKHMLLYYLAPLIIEQRTFATFRKANWRELMNFDDICPICLESMSKARITPCRHFFHPYCLKRWLQVSMRCPLCKHDFLASMQASE